jgi:nucleoside phosphorylase
MVESVELAAAETVETVLVVLAVTMESRTLAAAADRWEMPVAVTEH